MIRFNRLIAAFVFLLPFVANAQTSACLTTLAPTPAFVPPAPYDALPASNGTFWYGTDELWTAVGVDGNWRLKNNADKDGGYVTKLIYWRKGFDWRQESEPNLIVTAQRIDGDSPSVAVSHASAVFVTGKTPAMMTGIRIPTRGCWEVTAFYGGRSLTFIVSVEP